ncbi:30S ribosomal protein S27ae [Candidatus Micrarchaeota archaeon CG11_big_fil_rev_8_21_14_0_20_47_5]|nr:MAG: 30S ribosomal protein S27ae [Candidatus Micrarchaeota archaeon CG11_big_fil_rev_8_21_14_0_20_47_5]
MAEEKKPAKKKVNAKAYVKIGRTCPKCGPKKRLAKHANRLSCGNCGYFERV